MLELLPARLRLNPRWAAAGAVAGAMAASPPRPWSPRRPSPPCPLWTGLGAVLRRMAKPAATTDSNPAGRAPDFSTAVNGAALFAIVLELQGRAEAAITRIIDRVAGDDEPPELHDAALRAPWLDALRGASTWPAGRRSGHERSLPSSKSPWSAIPTPARPRCCARSPATPVSATSPTGPATTRHVEGTLLLVDGVPLIELYDTPGLEDSIGLLEQLDKLRGDRRHDWIEVIRAFLTSPAAQGDFEQEAKAMRQVLASDVALYVVDARDRMMAKHRDELEILARCTRPVVPVLNFIASPEARTAEWREHLAKVNLHAVVEFDTVVVDEYGEQRLFEKTADPAGPLPAHARGGDRRAPAPAHRSWSARRRNCSPIC